MPTLEITTVARCTIQCTYCPQDKLAIAYGTQARTLSYADFFGVIRRLPRHVRVDFSGFVEPWLNPTCSSMLEATLERGFHVGVYTTLQGMTDPTHVANLLEGNRDQVEVVSLHLPDANGNMPGHSHNKAWRRALDVFLALRNRGTIERFEIMTMDSEGTSVVPVGQLTRFVGVDRAGALDRAAVRAQPVEEPVLHEGPVSCSYTPFYDQNVMLPNGDVALCCNDYGLQSIIGNLFRQTWYELDRGRMLNANLEGHKTICKRCTRATSYRQGAGHQMWEVAS